ncbi:MAG: glycosyltransferase family 9 protein [Vampirovibrio sp.]|nr:glycosyltransferase family 9 protein [Vampirovibrio sp.]
MAPRSHLVKHPIQKLLLIRLGAMGDLIHLSPSITEIQRQRPDIEVHILTSPAFAEMVSGFEGMTADRVWVFEKPSGALASYKNIGDMARKLGEIGIDGVVNLHPSFKTWLLTRMILGRSKGKRSSVYHKQKLRKKGSRQRTISRRHAVDDFYVPVQKLLKLSKMADHAPYYPTNRSQQQDTAASGFWVAVIPGVGSKRANRAWPLRYWRRLIDSLVQEHGCRVVLIGGQAEQQTAEMLAMETNAVNRCGDYSIIETIEVLSHCHLAIGGDTGPVHLAAAVGLPVISVFGPTAVSRTGPLGRDRIEALTPPQSLGCWPCELSECPLPGDQYLSCMTQVTVEEVIANCVSIGKEAVGKDQLQV